MSCTICTFKLLIVLIVVYIVGLHHAFSALLGHSSPKNCILCEVWSTGSTSVRSCITGTVAGVVQRHQFVTVPCLMYMHAIIIVVGD